MGRSYRARSPIRYRGGLDRIFGHYGCYLLKRRILRFTMCGACAAQTIARAPRAEMAPTNVTARFGQRGQSHRYSESVSPRLSTVVRRMVCGTTVPASPHFLDVGQRPAAIEVRLRGCVEPEVREPELVGHRFHPVAFLA